MALAYILIADPGSDQLDRLANLMVVTTICIYATYRVYQTVWTIQRRGRDRHTTRLLTGYFLASGCAAASLGLTGRTLAYAWTTWTTPLHQALENAPGGAILGTAGMIIGAAAVLRLRATPKQPTERQMVTYVMIGWTLTGMSVTLLIAAIADASFDPAPPAAVFAGAAAISGLAGFWRIRIIAQRATDTTLGWMLIGMTITLLMLSMLIASAEEPPPPALTAAATATLAATLVRRFRNTHGDRTPH